jgi:two-component system, OmpR family, sensor histidine kinase BaeS
MFRTLRSRFILSHILPLLVTVPLIGIALIYLLETRILLPTLTNELTEQARLLADLTRDQPGVWSDRDQSQGFVARTYVPAGSRLMLLDRSGRLLASSNPQDLPRLAQVLNHPDLDQVLAGAPLTHEDYSARLGSEIADVFVPVTQADGTIAGVVRLSYELTGVYTRFSQLRWLIGGVLLVAVLLGAGVGYLLAVNLARPIRQMTQAINQLASAQHPAPLPEPAPVEIGTLAHSVNVLTERLRNLEAARRQLLANLVHELGRPLGALQSATQALQGGADEDLALRRELLTGIDHEIRRLRRLLDDLAAHYDQLLGPFELRRQTIQLADWLVPILAPWREAAQRKGLRWQVSLPATDLRLSVDPDRLAQAIENLVGNAIKYTAAGGSILIAVETDRAGLSIHVQDTGSGIAPLDQAHIFEPFFRGQAMRRLPQGMGLGLTIARDVVTAHGGRIDFTSSEGQGTRFTIWLPLDSNDPSPVPLS